MPKLTPKEIKKILALRALFPRTLSVAIMRSDDAGFSAHISNLPGCHTQAETLSELVEMLNDCVRTYLEVPAKYISYMPNYLPEVAVAQKFDMFPVARAHGTVQLTLANRETAAR